ncbi:ATP-binding protein [Streptomyces sp. NPDC003077]|uniref:ATP-binding protein n=1 Tax=Streptomyces sp. NPDC003077 TaxID=3154443 RepID=UPI0033BAD209
MARAGVRGLMHAVPDDARPGPNSLRAAPEAAGRMSVSPEPVGAVVGDGPGAALGPGPLGGAAVAQPVGDAPETGAPGTAEPDAVWAAWRVDAHRQLTISVTDGGGPTRPQPATPSITAHGGRGLAIIRTLAKDWGVRDEEPGEVTVWAVLALPDAYAARGDRTPHRTNGTALPPGLAPALSPDLAFADLDEPAQLDEPA